MITQFENFKFYKIGSPITYSGVILDMESHNKLLETFIYNNPDFTNWIKVAHHMTICLGQLPEHIRKYYLDEDAVLTVTHFGYNDKVAAVKVEGLFTINKPDIDEGPIFQHITLAFEPNAGKPQMSNEIQDWSEVERFEVSGKIEEIKIN